MSALKKSRRWMLKFEAVLRGANHTPDAVLKYIAHQEDTDPNHLEAGNCDAPVIIVHSPDVFLREPSGTINSDPKVVNRQPTGPAGVHMPENDQNPGQKEVVKVVQFNQNGFRFSEVLAEEADGLKQVNYSDLRFRAILRSRITKEMQKTPFKHGNWAFEEDVVAELASALNVKPVMPNCPVPVLKDFDYILPILYIAQPIGYFLVAELIESEADPLIRRLLVSIHQEDKTGKRAQHQIFSPCYSIQKEGKLHTIGFHQDGDEKGVNFWLEFLVGRYDNYTHFATHHLSNKDFAFKVNDATEIYVGCWPVTHDKMLCFQGDIKEIICDPHGDCTVC